MNIETQSEQTRIVWMDVLRLVALFMLVCCHCATQFSWSSEAVPDSSGLAFWGAFWGSMLRPVPVFVMLTGALLLPVKTSTSSFYKKRITRVAAPFFIWTLLYCFYPLIVKALGMSRDTLFSCFPYAGYAFWDAPVKSAVNSILHTPFNFSEMNLHLWFVYLIVGLYLYMPIFSCWVEKASDKAKLWFLGAWAVTSLLPYYNLLVEPYIWGSCTWNVHFHTLYYFAGWNGYLLMGHYLRNKTWSARKVLSICIPMLIIGYLITYFGHRWTCSIEGHSEEMFELFWTNNTLNIIMVDVSIFMICKLAVVKSVLIKNLLANLTLCCFGVYMVHFFFVGPIVNMFMSCVPMGVVIPLSGIVTLIVSWMFVAAFYRIIGPKAKWIFG